LAVRSQFPLITGVVLVGGIALSGLASEGPRQTPPGVKRINDSILVVNAEGTNSVVVKGSDRVAVIDAGPGPAAAETVLGAIEAVYGVADVRIVVSTHCHWDHVDGNQVFGDAVIIAHSSCPAAMARAFRDRRRLSSEPEPSAAPPPPPPGVTLPPPNGADTARVAGQTDEGQRMTSGLKARFASVRLSPPSITFTDEMTVDLGGRVLSLIAYGGGHSTSDILVALPDDGVLVSGDLFFHGQLPLITGDGVPEPSRWVVALERLAEVLEAQVVIPGHGELMTRDELRFCERYIRWLVAGVESAGDETVDSLLNGPLALKKLPRPWPHNLDPEVAVSVHRANVETLVG
jgi:glyoxylase-like metal-dependent hydrolase (beta-lactamase superfamily II)